MNQTTIAVLIGFVAGIVGGYFGQSLASTSGGAATELDDSEVQQLRKELDDLKAGMSASKSGAATLEARARPDGTLSAEADSRILSEAAEEALLARVDERVAKAVDEKLEEMGAGKESRPARRSKKRVDLATAAAELELSAQQEDELRRIYKESEQKIYEMLAKPDGDPEDVKRELQEAIKEPGGRMKLMGKYMPKVMGNIGTIMTMQAEREAAIVKTLGPEKAKRLNEGYTVKEDDFLGMSGGMGFEARVDVDER